MLNFGGLKLHKCIHTFAVYMYVPASLFDNETPPHCTADMDCLIFSCSTTKTTLSSVSNSTQNCSQNMLIGMFACRFWLRGTNIIIPWSVLKLQTCITHKNIQVVSALCGLWDFERAMLLELKDLLK